MWLCGLRSYPCEEMQARKLKHGVIKRKGVMGNGIWEWQWGGSWKLNTFCWWEIPKVQLSFCFFSWFLLLWDPPSLLTLAGTWLLSLLLSDSVVCAAHIQSKCSISSKTHASGWILSYLSDSHKDVKLIHKWLGEKGIIWMSCALFFFQISLENSCYFITFTINTTRFSWSHLVLSIKEYREVQKWIPIRKYSCPRHALTFIINNCVFLLHWGEE